MFTDPMQCSVLCLQVFILTPLYISQLGNTRYMAESEMTFLFYVNKAIRSCVIIQTFQAKLSNFNSISWNKKIEERKGTRCKKEKKNVIE